jgi:hypothetical protein
MHVARCTDGVPVCFYHTCRPGILSGTSRRRLTWDSAFTDFSSYWVQADKAVCANESLSGGFPGWYFAGGGGYGQLVYDSGVCNQAYLGNNAWVSN